MILHTLPIGRNGRSRKIKKFLEHIDFKIIKSGILKEFWDVVLMLISESSEKS